MKDVAAGDDVRLHARLRAKDARQVFGLRADNGGGCFVPMFGDPAAASHLFSCQTLTRLEVYGVAPGLVELGGISRDS